MELFNLRLEVTKNLKSENWSESDLFTVLKQIKKYNSVDSHSLISELFHPEIIGKDLFSSLLLLCNSVKTQLLIPEFITFTDITSIYKLTGEKCDRDNDHGIFGVSKVQSIIENLTFQDSYEIVDENMSD